ncbi:MULTISPECIES: TetR/AcrR family transcriptional regulator [Streptomyces]|uniref:TetR/AcrR family transcriptional regulator n=1 Tax=Streptomyces sudanensis TaxID=436397 RepID=A0ABY4TEG8_9ACTN|nr:MULTISPECIES: TetR/AcrR family transcriptional regulator [Streptomyces]MCP9986036.1 TetR/AcrR family transcriptional regulator [Streptomyces sudanensis]URN17329.1 TetR/AcrR family transcriptional regulator [Streptomyces sudanensis]
MARPPRFDTDQFLDAAVRLAAAGGPSAVTMSAVAHAVGAPSGSVYHRFAGRTALLAEVWLRTVERFQDGYHAALVRESDPREAARAATRYAVSWSRTNPDEVALLLYGAADFGRADWSEEHVRRADLGNRRVLASLGALAEALGATDERSRERVTLALIDLPLSVVRRHLRAGEPLPPYAEDLVEECAAALLA